MVRVLKPTIKTLDYRTVRPSQTHERLRGREGIRSRTAVLSDEPLCRRCSSLGRTTLATVVDHITPLAHGGSNARSNLQPLCVPCHDIKTAEDFGQTKHHP